MDISILTQSDENFRIIQTSFGDRILLPDEEREQQSEDPVVIKNDTKIAEEKIIQNNAAPLENSRAGHPFDPYGGTSWEGKKQDFN
jgi:hypothetical protein